MGTLSYSTQETGVGDMPEFAGLTLTGTLSFTGDQWIKSGSKNRLFIGDASTRLRFSNANYINLDATGVVVAGSTVFNDDVTAYSFNTAGVSTAATFVCDGMNLNGNGIYILDGTTAGFATLVAGTVTVTNTNFKNTSKIFLSVKTLGGTQGFLRYSVIDNTSFTITSSSGADTSTIAWFGVRG